MDQYFDKFYTPLKYHKFLKFAGFPVSFLVGLLNIFSIVSRPDVVLDSLQVTELLYQSVFTMVLGITLYGFYTWKPWGFYGVLANQGLGVLYNIYAIVVYARIAPDMIGAAVIELLARGVVAALVTIYYCKRRPLFFPKMQAENLQKTIAQQVPKKGSSLLDR